MKTLMISFTFLAATLYFTKSVSAQDISINDQLKGFGIEKVEGKELIINIKMEVENPSGKKVGVTIKKGQLFKDGEFYGTYKVLEKVKLHRITKETVDIRLKVQLEKDLKVLEEGLMVLMGKTIKFKVTGVVKATWFIFWKKYPFDYEEKLSVKNLMKH